MLLKVFKIEKIGIFIILFDHQMMIKLFEIDLQFA